MHRLHLKVIPVIAITLAVNVLAQTSPSTNGVARFVDQVTGITSDQAVALALENNGELQATRKEVEASRAMVKQASLRPNPKLTTGGAKQIGGGDNNQMAEVMAATTPILM